MTTTTYRGSCACGTITYEVDLDLSAGTTRCNCTVCTKTGTWGAMTKPANFRLLSGAESLGDWSRFPVVHTRFCARCGVRTHGHGDIEALGGEYVGVNLNTLDGVDLTGTPVTLLDGLHDTWAELGRTTHRSPFAG